MTFEKYQEAFKAKYPNGRTWMHNDMCRDQSGYKGKVAVEFVPGGKLYFYTGAYEDVLNKIGVNSISKERYSTLTDRLARYLEMNGQEDLFGCVIDLSREIAETQAELKRIETECVVI